SIAHNTRQFPKDLRAMREDGPLPVLVPARDAVQQAAFVAQRILELRDEGFPLREIAVLYRAHHQSMELQIELARRGIPFHVRSGVRFFEQAHIKDVLCFLRLAHNPADELAFRRAVRLFSGIGAKTADRLWTAFSGAAGSAADRLGTLELPAIRSTAGYEAFRRLVAAVAEFLAAPGTAIETVLSSMYEEHLRTSFLNADARVEDIRQLAAWAAQFPDANAFLAEVSLLSDLSAQDVVEAAE